MELEVLKMLRAAKHSLNVLFYCCMWLDINYDESFKSDEDYLVDLQSRIDERIEKIKKVVDEM